MLFIEWLDAHQSEWESFQASYKDYKRLLVDSARKESRAASFRLAEFGAAVELAAMLAHRAGILPWAFEGAWDVMLWNDVVSQVAGANGEERAIRHVLSWAQSHEESFHGRERTDRSGHSVPPMGGWAGKWDHEYEWSEICFFPSVLKGILEEAAFDYDGILSAWKERGWLDTNKSPGHYTKVSWIDSKSTRLVVIKRAGVEAAEAI